MSTYPSGTKNISLHQIKRPSAKENVSESSDSIQTMNIAKWIVRSNHVWPFFNSRTQKKNPLVGCLLPHFLFDLPSSRRDALWHQILFLYKNSHCPVCLLTIFVHKCRCYAICMALFLSAPHPVMIYPFNNIFIKKMTSYYFILFFEKNPVKLSLYNSNFL